MTAPVRYALLTAGGYYNMSNVKAVKAPALTNAQKQANYKARLKDMAARGAAAIHAINQFEAHVMRLSADGEPVVGEIWALMDGKGLDGLNAALAAIARDKAAKRQQEAMQGRLPLTKAPSRAKAPKAPARPAKPKAAPRAVGSATVRPSKGKRAPVASGNG